MSLICHGRNTLPASLATSPSPSDSNLSISLSVILSPSSEASELSPEFSRFVDEESSDEAVRAPLAGVFYRASKPGAAPYVEPGKHVEKGDIIGLIEAMKMMSEVPAPYAGTVKEIRAEDGVFAGYNDVLMTIVRD